MNYPLTIPLHHRLLAATLQLYYLLGLSDQNSCWENLAHCFLTNLKGLIWLKLSVFSHQEYYFGDVSWMTSDYLNYLSGPTGLKSQGDLPQETLGQIHSVDQFL